MYICIHYIIAYNNLYLGQVSYILRLLSLNNAILIFKLQKSGKSFIIHKIRISTMIIHW